MSNLSSRRSRNSSNGQPSLEFHSRESRYSQSNSRRPDAWAPIKVCPREREIYDAFMQNVNILLGVAPIRLLIRKFKGASFLAGKISTSIACIVLFLQHDYYWGSFGIMTIILPSFVTSIAVGRYGKGNERFIEEFGVCHYWPCMFFLEIKLAALEVCGNLPKEEAALNIFLNIAQGCFGSLPWSLLQAYIYIREWTLGRHIILQHGLSLIPANFFAIYAVCSSCDYLIKTANITHEGNRIDFLVGLLQLGDGMAPPKVLDDLRFENHVLIRDDLSLLDLRGLHSIGKAIRTSKVIETVRFYHTGLGEKFKEAITFNQHVWQQNFSECFRNRHRLKVVTFEPALPAVAADSFEYSYVRQLKKVYNGKTVLFDSKPKHSMLHHAVWTNDKDDLITDVLDDDIDSVEREEEAMWAARLDSWRALDAFLYDDPELASDPTLLVTAVKGQAINCVQLLLEKRADASSKAKNNKGKACTPLFAAVSSGNRYTVNILIDASADVMEDGLLEESARRNSPSVADCLIQHGADVKYVTKKGFTALHAAANVGSPLVAHKLVQAKADINAQTGEKRNKSTALMLAIKRGQRETVKALLKMGADANLSKEENNVMETTLQMATKSEMSDILRPYLSKADHEVEDVEYCPLLSSGKSYRTGEQKRQRAELDENEMPPHPWTRHFDDDGAPFYVNEVSGERQWEFP